MLRVDVPSGTEPATYVWEELAQHLTPSVFAFSGTVYAKSTFSLRLFEAVRVRVAQINGCELCQSWRSKRDVPAMLDAYGVSSEDSNIQDPNPPDEAFYEAVERWRAAPQFSERERAAIEFTDRYVSDPRSLEDEQLWDEMHAHFSDDEIVELALIIGAFFTLGRLQAALGIDDACQIETMFADKEKVAAS
jgi:alkylhydroperoxidase family enzyme